MATLRGFGAVTEVMGWDEAFVAVETDDPEGFAREIAAGIRAATQLDATVGIGQNKLQAKLATGFQAGRRVPADPRDLVRCPGRPSYRRAVGDRGQDRAEAVRAGRRDRQRPGPRRRDALAAEFGPATGPWLVRLARGQDHSPVSSAPYLPPSRGREVTCQVDLDDWDQVRAEVVRLAGLVTADVVAEERPAVRVVVKVRYAPFFTSSHSRSLPGPTADADAIAGGGARRAGRVHRPAAGPAAGGAGRVRRRRLTPGGGFPPWTQLLPRLRAARMICVTSYRLSPSLRAISSGRRPCWLSRAGGRRCDGVPGSRGPRGAAGLAFAGPEQAGAALAGRTGPGWAVLAWAGAAGRGGPWLTGDGLGLAEGAAPLVVVLALGQLGLGVLVQQQVLLGRLVDPDRDHGQALEVLRLALRLHAVVVFPSPLGMQFIPAADALGHVRFRDRHSLSKTTAGSLMFHGPG